MYGKKGRFNDPAIAFEDERHAMEREGNHQKDSGARNQTVYRAPKRPTDPRFDAGEACDAERRA